MSNKLMRFQGCNGRYIMDEERQQKVRPCFKKNDYKCANTLRCFLIQEAGGGDWWFQHQRCFVTNTPMLTHQSGS